MIQLSTYVYCDSLFEKIDSGSPIFASAYNDYPYLIIKDFFSEEECRVLTTLSQEAQSDKIQAQIRKDKHEASEVIESYRKTNIGTLNTYYTKLYDEKFSMYKEVIEKYFSVALTIPTKPQLLEYTKGYFYVQHADDSSVLVNKEKEVVGFKVVAPKRKLSSVLFITAHENEAKGEDVCFKGGELLFNYLYDEEGVMIKVESKAGDMIVFPSHPYFSHEVLAVEEGYRLTLVQWHDTV